MNAHLQFQRQAKRKKERKKTANIEIGFIFTLNRFHMHAYTMDYARNANRVIDIYRTHTHTPMGKIEFY